jgi:hypothetical protein
MVQASAPFIIRSEPKKMRVPYAYLPYLTDVHSQTLSPEALQLAEHLGLSTQLSNVSAVKLAHQKSGDLSPDKREQFRDDKEEIVETIEQTRLEIDFTQAELAREEAVYAELLAVYTSDRDRKVDFINAWGYRTNGVLWALAEGLDIPTYRNPRLSIPSGITGIIAGLIPSAFSLFALREEDGGKFDRKPHPNMLSKVFGYQVTPDLEYPDSIWSWLNSVPPDGKTKLTRINYLIDWWRQDQNIRNFGRNPTRVQLDLLTATTQDYLTIQLVSDRLAMIRQIRALILGMNRPLLELMMVVRGTKFMTRAEQDPTIRLQK